MGVLVTHFIVSSWNSYKWNIFCNLPNDIETSDMHKASLGNPPLVSFCNKPTVRTTVQCSPLRSMVLKFPIHVTGHRSHNQIFIWLAQWGTPSEVRTSVMTWRCRNLSAANQHNFITRASVHNLVKRWRKYVDVQWSSSPVKLIWWVIKIHFTYRLPLAVASEWAF